MYGSGYSMAIVLDHRSTATSLTGNWGKLRVKLEFSIKNWGKLLVKLEFCHVGRCRVYYLVLLLQAIANYSCLAYCVAMHG